MQSKMVMINIMNGEHIITHIVYLIHLQDRQASEVIHQLVVMSILYQIMVFFYIPGE